MLKRANRTDIWGRGNSKHKGPEVRAFLAVGGTVRAQCGQSRGIKLRAGEEGYEHSDCLELCRSFKNPPSPRLPTFREWEKRRNQQKRQKSRPARWEENWKGVVSWKERRREWLCHRVWGHTAYHTTGWQIKRRGVGAMNSSFTWKASRSRRERTSVPKNHLTQVRIQASFILKGEGVWLVAGNFLVLEFFVPSAVHVGPVTIFL